ncbi:MAG: 30S ribosomal protein S16 [Bacilli bacterium]|nr:30S ribosomal protein S16 [Bacilli bacterium]
MAVKIRLTKIGRHKDPFYRIVAADSRYARDGRYIEQIGYFDPDKGVENAVINEELALKWLEKGAQPSDTVKSIFSKKGVIAKHASKK